MTAFPHSGRLLILSLLIAGFGVTRKEALGSDFDLLNDDDFGTSPAFSSPEDSSSPRGGGLPWELTLAPVYAILSGPQYRDINFSNGPAVEGGLYYQIHRWIQVGVDGGYSFGHDHRDTIFTFDGIDFLIEDRIEVARITPTIKVGSWQTGPRSWRWRPYAQAGIGWYEILYKQNFKLEANRGRAHFQLEERTDDYLGANAGGGLEVEVYPQGVIGVHVAYHRVFSKPQNLQFFTPSLRFSYLF